MRITSCSPQEYRFLTPRGGTDVRMPSELCTQNSSVLRLLASCPVLQDPEIWSLWSYCSSSSLASHWGPLEEFLSDIAIDGESKLIALNNFLLVSIYLIDFVLFLSE